MTKKLNDPKFNILIIFVVEIITCSISFSANYSGAGMSAIIIKWIPGLIGLTTILFYVISRLVTKKYNWIISLIGIIFMFISAINIYSTDFSKAF